MRLNIEEPGRLDEVFAALAHPHRRELVRRLAGGDETPVGVLAEHFDVSLNQVSKHLKILERAGLVRRRREGREHRIRLDPRPLAEAGSWINAYRVFWNDALEELADFLDEAAPTDTSSTEGAA
jgi:DNA-binding transcriptional ArsR family regulator